MNRNVTEDRDVIASCRKAQNCSALLGCGYPRFVLIALLGCVMVVLLSQFRTHFLPNEDHPQTVTKRGYIMSMLNLVNEGLPANYPYQPEWEVTPRHLKQLMDDQEAFVLLDIREPHEYEISHIDPNTFIPMRQLPAQLEHLREHEDDHVIVLCRTGVRSLEVAYFLRDQGFTDVYSLAGGINQWATTFDKSLPTY